MKGKPKDQIQSFNFCSWNALHFRLCLFFFFFFLLGKCFILYYRADQHLYYANMYVIYPIFLSFFFLICSGFCHTKCPNTELFRLSLQCVWLTQLIVVGQTVVTNEANKTYSVLELTNPLSVLQPLCLCALIVKIMPFIYGNQSLSYTISARSL